MAFLNKNTALAIAALVACGSAAARKTTTCATRRAYGAADMSAPFEGGWVFQAHAYVYSGNVRGTQTVPTDLTGAARRSDPLPPGPPAPTTVIHTNDQINVNGLLPRLSYMSATTFLGATLGGTVLLPLVNKGSEASVHGISTTLTGIAAGPAAANQAALIASSTPAPARRPPPCRRELQQDLGHRRPRGLADPALEHRSHADAVRHDRRGAHRRLQPRPRRQPERRQVLDVPSGRPVQLHRRRLGRGTRVAYSYNTRNVETQYKSGAYLNWDLALMKSVSESTRVGLSAYAVDQLNKDTTSLTAAEFAAKDAAFQARQEARWTRRAASSAPARKSPTSTAPATTCSKAAS
jgi:hypothetical protein